MRVWSQLSSPHRQYFKDMTIYKPQSIDEYLSYLKLLGQKNDNLQNYRDDIQNINNKKVPQPKSKRESQVPSNYNSTEQQYKINILQIKRPGDEMIQVANEDGKIQKIPMRNLLPMANLQLFIQNKPFNPFTHLYINQRALGIFRTQILQKCPQIPLSQIVTSPNIINMIQSKTQCQLLQQKKFKKSQKRSHFLPVNQKIYFQLVNADIPLKQLNYQSITNSYFVNEYKQLYDYYEQKIQQLLIDKELTTICLYILNGNFFCQSQIQQKTQTSFPLVQKKYIYSLFNFIQQRKNKFWPYQTLSLKSILSLYDIFLDKTHYKLTLYFDQSTQSVQKIQVKPFVRFSDDMVGKGFVEMIMQTKSNQQSNLFSFKGSIFQILINASSQMKAYYKIPDLNPVKSTQFQSSKVTLEDLIENMSQIGFKMSEISSILRNFALIMNIVLLQVQEKQKKTNQFSTFHMGLKQNLGYKNIRSLYAGQLTLIESILLNQQINVANFQQQNNSSTLIKKQILATILWQFAINRFVNEINSKIQNVSKDLSKTKKFQIFCHYNSKIGERLDEQTFVQEGTFQSTEYQIVGKKLVEKQFFIQKQDQNFDQRSNKSKDSSLYSKNNKKIDSSLAFRNFVQNCYLSALEKEFTSFNSYFINTRRFSFNLYKLMTSFRQIKKIAEQIFHMDSVQETSQKYWKQFFQFSGQNNGQIIQNNYIICGDYHKFIHQEKQGKKLLEFYTKLILESLSQDQNNDYNSSFPHNNKINSQKIQSINQIQKLCSLTPRNQINNNQNISLSSPKQIIKKKTPYQTNKKKILFIETQNLQSPQFQSQTNPSIMKTPKRLIFSIQLPHLINKYLYGNELKVMYRFFKQISLEFANQVKTYNTLKIHSLMEQSIIEINLYKDQLIQTKYNQRILPQKLNDDQLKKLLQVQFFDLFYDVYKQIHYIQVSQILFFKIQQQTNIQKQAVFKIIKLFRSHKFRKNHQIFMFRKKFLKKIHNLCRLAKFAQKAYYLLYNKHSLLLKNSFYKLKIKSHFKKLMEAVEKVFSALKNHFKNYSFVKIKKQSFIELSCQKIFESCVNISLNQKKQAFQCLKPGQYSLMVTSPTGTKKNLDILSIDVQNVNDTSVIHSGNMSTSNVKNLLNKSEDKKLFMKKDIPQEVDIRNESQKQKSHEKQKNQTIKQQKEVQVGKNIETNNEKQNISTNQKSQVVRNTLPVNKPILLQRGPEEKSKIPETIEERSQMSKSKVSQLSKSKVSQLSNDIVSVLNSGMSGSLISCKSQNCQKFSKLQLFTLKDSPFFSFESWSKQTRTFHNETQINKPSPVLFRKPEAQKIKANEQTSLEVSQEVSLKQKIVNASFVSFLRQNLNKTQKQTVQQICYYQKKTLQKPLLKHYVIQKHGQFFKETFNHILKVSLFKNTSKKLFQLLNLLLKPIRDVYRQQKSTQQRVFQDQPLVVTSYESVYNLYRDEMFIQFAKQLMGNKDEDSLNSITFVLEIITKNYYPSSKLFYAFLNFIKTNQLSKPQLYSRVYENLIKFAQALQGYKGSHIRIYKQQPYVLTQLQYHQYLQPRQSLFVNEECKFMANKITVSLYNGEKFEFIIRNETLRTVKKRMLVELGFPNFQKNFGLYQQRRQNNYYIVSQKQKAVDYLARTAPDSSSLTLRLRQYYPIKFTDINSLRMFYLNQISEEIRLPFKPEDYEHVVALGISFDEFQQTRIGNYMLLSKKEKLGDEQLKGIKNKLELYAQIQGDRRICQFEYFKTIKQFNFLLAKSYKIPKQKPKFMQQIDKLIVKPKQLCFYASTVMKSSLSLYRIKSFYFQNEEIHIQLIYSDRDLSDGHDKKFHGSVKSLTLKGFSKMNQLYEDVVYYTELLQLGKGK